MQKDIIYNEDCLVGMGRIPDKSVDMILCDLPYGVTARNMGSGTTAIACINTNRHYIGFELDKGYYDIAIKRIADTKEGVRNGK